MALESFYGGKQGVSPVIKARFKYVTAEKDDSTGKYYDEAYSSRLNKETVLTREEAIWLTDSKIFKNDNTPYAAGEPITWTAELLKPFVMDECLKDVHYTDVWYGELCIIDTDNKLNPNNGKLYRRTLKQVDNRFVNTQDTRYAEYIGQIVGPSGGVPNFDFGSLDEERKKAAGQAKTYEDDPDPNDLDNSSWDYSYKDKNQKLTTVVPNNYEDIGISESGVPDINNNTANIQMVPGKNGAKYNDTIRYTWCNVRRKLNGKDSDAWIYLGFEIPFTVYDVIGTEENYTYNGEVFEDNSLDEHPFAKAYSFHIPRGARGIGPEELFIVGKDGQTKPNTLYPFNAIQYNQSTDTYSIKSNINSFTPTEKTYWVAKWRLYNPKTEDINDVYQYIGAYKDIAEVELLNNGKLNIKYSDKNEWIELNTLKWIESLSINTDKDNDNYGTFSVKYNTETENTPIGVLPLIKSNTYDRETGLITFNYAGKNEDLSLKTDTPIKDIQEIKIDELTGNLLIKYRGDNNFTDIGQVRGNAVAGIVYTLQPQGQSLSYSSTEAALTDLQTRNYVESDSTTIGGNTGDNAGRIKVNNNDVTGGLVAAKIKEANSDKEYTAIFYFNNTPKTGSPSWTLIGTMGDSTGGGSGKSNVYIQESNGTTIYPKDTDPNPQIYFVDGTNTEATSLFTIKDFSPWVNPTQS